MTVGAGIALDQVEAVHRDEETVAAVVIQPQELPECIAETEFHQAPVDADPVLDVNHVIAECEL